MLALTADRKKLMKQFPNLVDGESKPALPPLLRPEAAARRRSQEDRRRGQDAERAPRPGRADLSALHAAAQEARRRIRIGIPKMLNIWSTAPFWRTYLETLGIQKNVVFSDDTTEEMWAEGGKYGSIDPATPPRSGRRTSTTCSSTTTARPLRYIFNPVLTTIPSFVKNAMDYTRARSWPGRPTC